jgi:hypothetical protein
MNNGGVRPCNLAFTQAASDPAEFTCHDSVDSLKRARHVPMARPMLSIATGLSRAGAQDPIILPTSFKRHEVSSVRHEGEELTRRPSSPAFGFERNQLILNQFPQYLWDVCVELGVKTDFSNWNTKCSCCWLQVRVFRRSRGFCCTITGLIAPLGEASVHWAALDRGQCELPRA